MTALYSKQVSDREKSSREVLAALDTHVRDAASRLDETLIPYAAPAAGGAPALSIEPLLGALRGWLDATTQAMVKADFDHLAEQRDDAPVFARRDQAATELYQFVTSVRAAYTDRFGVEFGAALGVKGTTPVDAQSLFQFSGNLTRAVEEVVAQNPASSRSFVTLDHALALSTLRQLRQTLGAALDDAARERRENETSQIAKDRAIATYDAAFRFVASFAELALNLAGESKLASRVRPSRRPGITAGVADAPVTPAEPAAAP